jgi:hypothetical protein
LGVHSFDSDCSEVGEQTLCGNSIPLMRSRFEWRLAQDRNRSKATSILSFSPPSNAFGFRHRAVRSAASSRNASALLVDFVLPL